MAASSSYPNVAIVLGGQWGDEGKGKLTDILSGKYNVCARYNGGSNAGHTIVKNGTKFATHLLPSGILTDDMTSVIGSGVVLHIPTLWNELSQLEKGGISWGGRLLISDRAHVVFEFHRAVDSASEGALGSSKLGTTGRGIGPTYSQKMMRSGLRVHHLFEPDFADKYRRALNTWLRSYPEGLEVTIKNPGDTEAKLFRYPDYADAEIAYYQSQLDKLRPLVVDSAEYFDLALQAGRTILIESANAVMLDIDHGTYPFVTSSSPTVGGASTGLGIPICKLGSALVVGIVKAYTTRVGAGPFPSELSIEEGPGQILQTVGREVGTTTGRKRRCGWLDLPIVKYGHRLNGYSSINLTKLDVLDTLDEIKVCTSYTLDGKTLSTCPASLFDLERVVCEYTTFPGWKQPIDACRTFADLPPNAQAYVSFIQKELGIPIRWIGVGPASDAMIEIL